MTPNYGGRIYTPNPPGIAPMDPMGFYKKSYPIFKLIQGCRNRLDGGIHSRQIVLIFANFRLLEILITRRILVNRRNLRSYGSRELIYWNRLKRLRIMSLQRIRERYCIIHVWKILDGYAPNDIGMEFQTR